MAKVTIEFTGEELQSVQFDAIMQLLRGSTPDPSAAPESKKATRKAATQDTAPEISAAAAPATKDTPAAQTAPAAPSEAAEDTEEQTYTLADVRAQLGQLLKAGRRDEVAALLKKYDATQLGEVDPAQYGNLMREAKAL